MPLVFLFVTLGYTGKPFLSLSSFFLLLPDILPGRQIHRLATIFCVPTVPTLNSLVVSIVWTNTLIAREYSDCSPDVRC